MPNNKQESFSPKQFTCIGMSEIDKYASELLKKRFPKTTNFGDATKIKPEDLPDFDMLCGGFPCQTFSIAGRRQGFNDTRGTMFYEIVRILKVKRPKIVLLENVKGLLSHDRGRTFAIIISNLAELGYNVQWMVLNSKFFGVPQNRERVFIIGSLRNEPRPEILPFRTSSQETNEQQSRVSFPTVFASQHKIARGMPMIEQVIQINPSKESGGRQPYQQNRVYDKEGIIPALPAQLGGDRNHIINTMKIRKLTPLECERLQGFPDNWTKGFSDTQRYKMMGNAVTVNVIKAIAEKLLRN